MLERPILNKQLDSKTFKNFYYLKEELVSFCKSNGLPTSGNKIEMANRISYFLDTGEVLLVEKYKKPKIVIEDINEYTKIEPNFICSNRHRAFFKSQIGDNFSFNVTFQKWLKHNVGKTYKQAIEAYYEIIDNKKKGTTTIDKQFEYNTYIRDFFADNKGKSLKEAIQCWKYKKQIIGHNCYEKTDLIALNSQSSINSGNNSF